MVPFAFVFPGQGSQSVGMLDGWGDHAAVRDTLAEASDALGTDVARLIREGPKEQLDLTTNTQPVMLTAGIACYRAWRAESGSEPTEDRCWGARWRKEPEPRAVLVSGYGRLADAGRLDRLNHPLA